MAKRVLRSAARWTYLEDTPYQHRIGFPASSRNPWKPQMENILAPRWMFLVLFFEQKRNKNIWEANTPERWTLTISPFHCMGASMVRTSLPNLSTGSHGFSLDSLARFLTAQGTQGLGIASPSPPTSVQFSAPISTTSHLALLFLIPDTQMTLPYPCFPG